MHLNLTIFETRTAIANYVNASNMGVNIKPEQVEFKITNHGTGYEPDMIFDGATVNLNPK